MGLSAQFPSNKDDEDDEDEEGDEDDEVEQRLQAAGQKLAAPSAAQKAWFASPTLPVAIGKE